MNIDIEQFSELLDEQYEKLKQYVGSKKQEPIVNRDYIQFKKIDLLKVLKIASPIFQLNSSRAVPKSIVITYTDGEYRMVTNNDVEYIDFKLDVENTENRLLDTICLPIQLIKSILDMMEETIVIYKSEDTYFMKLSLEGDLSLEIPQAEAGLLRRPVKDMAQLKTGNEDTQMSCHYVGEALKSLIPLLNEEMQLDRRRITFTGSRILFNSNKISMQFMCDTPRIKISLKLSEILRNLHQFYDDKPIKLYTDITSPSRIILVCDNVFITTMCTMDVAVSRAQEYLEQAQSVKHIKVDIDSLKRAVRTACVIPGTTGLAGFKYDKDNLVVFISTIGKRVTEFKIPIDAKLVSDDVLEQIKTPTYVPAKQLLKILDAYKGDTTNIAVTSTSVILNLNTITSIIERG